MDDLDPRLERLSKALRPFVHLYIEFEQTGFGDYSDDDALVGHAAPAQITYGDCRRAYEALFNIEVEEDAEELVEADA